MLLIYHSFDLKVKIGLLTTVFKKKWLFLGIHFASVILQSDPAFL